MTKESKELESIATICEKLYTETEPVHQHRQERSPSPAPSYPGSTVSAPPAYEKPRSKTVTIVKIVAGTFLVSVLLLGFFIVAASYVQGLASCRCDKTSEIDIATVEELTELPRVEALIQETTTEDDRSRQLDIELSTDDIGPRAKEYEESSNSVEEEKPKPSGPRPLVNRNPFLAIAKKLMQMRPPQRRNRPGHRFPNGLPPVAPRHRRPIPNKKPNIPLPLMLDIDELTSMLLQTQNRADMNCVVERRMGKPNLPFDIPGLNFDSSEAVVEVRCDNGPKRRGSRPEIHHHIHDLPTELRPPMEQLPFGLKPPMIIERSMEMPGPFPLPFQMTPLSGGRRGRRLDVPPLRRQLVPDDGHSVRPRSVFEEVKRSKRCACSCNC